VKHGTGNGRGRHKGRRSPEARRFYELEGELNRIFAANDPRKPKRQRTPKLTPKPTTPPPSRPPWLAEHTYRGLLELRRTAARRLEGDH
jgi:hypothetical protein